MKVYLTTAEETLKSLRVRRERGLSRPDVARRQKQYGYNVLPSRDGWRLFELFFSRWGDPLVLILLAAAVASLVLGERVDAVIIAVALVLDFALSFFQVFRTEHTLRRLREKMPDMVHVVRAGQAATIPVEELVPGDIIEIRSGERVPADARLISARGLFTHEATLTGEAREVAKTTTRMMKRGMLATQRNMLFAGTSVVAGSGVAVVVATGLNSEFGKIAKMLGVQTSPPSPLHRKLQRQGKAAAGLIVLAVAILAVVALVTGRSLMETARLSITLVVSAIPEDLTVILTVALTVGMMRILRGGGVVRELRSAEGLGAATVVCCDKTGTLTEGSMRATAFDFLQGDTVARESEIGQEAWRRMAVLSLVLASSAYRRAGDGGHYFGSATERATLQFAETLGITAAARSEWIRRGEIPFDQRWKYRAALADHPTQAGQMLCVVGAPEVLLEKSSLALTGRYEVKELSGTRRREIQNYIQALAAGGQRLLGVAVRRTRDHTTLGNRDVESLTMLGVLQIEDPVRHEVVSAIREAQMAGVAVKMVTGDHTATAVAVARHVGLTVPADAVCSGELLREISDEELSERLPQTVVFSRVEPLDKQRIIRLLQAQGEVVAMTGDGVNDAVALKSADIGVAMGGGSDIAKESADLVLLDNSFATIVRAIREGRVIRDNVRRVILFLLSTNAAEVAIFFVSLAFGLPLPLLPVQILWINLVTDGTSDLALSLERAERDVMKRRPEDPAASLIPGTLYRQLAWVGVTLTAATVGLFAYLLSRGAGEEYVRTMAFTFLATASLLSVWSFRSLTETIPRRGLWRNPSILLSTAASMGLQLVAIYVTPLQRVFQTVPLTLRDWMMIVGVAVITVIVIDLRKVVLPFKPHPHPFSFVRRRAII